MLHCYLQERKDACGAEGAGAVAGARPPHACLLADAANAGYPGGLPVPAGLHLPSDGRQHRHRPPDEAHRR
eukprot:2809316-Pyramimonas_sp.AAC.1